MRRSLSRVFAWRFPSLAGLAGFRGEVVLVVLVAFAALAVVNPPGPQDTSRLGLSEALLLGRTVQTDLWGGKDSLDVAFRAGHFYSDKAPGVAFLALVPLGVTEVLDHSVYHIEHLPLWFRRGHLWFIRVTTVGVVFLLGVLLVGRAAERIAPRTGALAAVAFGLGTIAGALAPTTFGHDAAASMCFLAFVSLWAPAGRASVLLAGAAAGAAVLFDYTAALACVIFAAWLLTRRERGAVAWFVAGGLPFAVLLGGYDWAAFGSPFHLSYRYVDNRFATDQAKGLFGISFPRLHGVDLTLVGPKGLFVLSPFLVLGAVGLLVAAFKRRDPRALVAVFVAAAFALVSFGYFDPYGGQSPGPRYFVPALPFLTLGLAYLRPRWKLLSAAAVAASVGLATFEATAWGTNARSLELTNLPYTIWMRIGLSASVGLTLIWIAATAAFLAACAAAFSRRPTEPARP